MSLLKSWEVWNFMSIEHGKCEFDESNIINLKGYNDSGKSAMLTALKVLLCNASPTKQVSFIQDDKDYFRVLATFDDGVCILRDKYLNGQSLYELYQNGNCLYSTKNGNTLTKVTEVPQPIADYLGLITYEGVCLNARACFEKQIGVQTTGSENYKMFNTVLKSEEIATAGTLLNNDKNKLASDIDATDKALQAQKTLLGTNAGITSEMVEWLKAHDVVLDELNDKVELLASVQSDYEDLIHVAIYPEVGAVDTAQLSALETLHKAYTEYMGVAVYPEVLSVDMNTLTVLTGLKELVTEFESLVDIPETPIVDGQQIADLVTLMGLVAEYHECNDEIVTAREQLDVLHSEQETLLQELANHGVKMVKCPDCGRVFEV